MGGLQHSRNGSLSATQSSARASWCPEWKGGAACREVQRAPSRTCQHVACARPLYQLGFELVVNSWSLPGRTRAQPRAAKRRCQEPWIQDGRMASLRIEELHERAVYRDAQFRGRFDTCGCVKILGTLDRRWVLG